MKIPSLIMMLLVGTWSYAQNPLVTHLYTADPTARVFDGKLYVYPSSDTIPINTEEHPRFCMPGYNVFTLEKGATWKDHGRILSNNDVPWGKKDAFAMWAPDCIKKDDKYYYYFPAKSADTGNHKIGVGVSKSPLGPFKWEKTPLAGVNGIDPGLLLDDDNKAYLYWGGGARLYVAGLKDNMKEILGDPIEIQGLPGGYKEGSFPFKRNGLYYLTFAHVFQDEGYTIGYATADNPFGPFTYGGKIMDNIDNGTNHHSVVEYQGQWILFYHWWDISGTNKLRSMRADYMEFRDDMKHNPGAIGKVIPTLRGIGTPTLGDTIQIDRYNEISDAQTAFVTDGEPTGWMVCEAKHNAYVRFNRVDFGDGSAKKFQARLASGQRFGAIEVHLNDPRGKKIAEWNIEYTGGWHQWKTVELELLSKIEGIHDLCVVFKGQSGMTKTANLNWLILN